MEVKKEPIDVDAAINKLDGHAKDPHFVRIMTAALHEMNNEGLDYADVALYLHELSTAIILSDAADWQELEHFSKTYRETSEVIGRTSLDIYSMGMAMKGNEIRTRPDDSQGDEWDNRLP